MNVLALDTATPSPSVCLLARGELFEEALSSDRRASEELLPAIRRVLDAAGVRLEECGRIAVCAGPGSFTGVRVGLATAWGLGRALGIPVEAVSTLEALAESARGRADPRVVAALDAGRGDLVCETFVLDGGRARSLAPARLVRHGDAAGLSEGAPVAALPPGLAGWPAAPERVSVAAALALAVARAPRPIGSPLAAIYSRPSAAEEKRGAP
jgi:tRNA threonylcarbamoyladenosine biosynthesis protein TsaB